VSGDFSGISRIFIAASGTACDSTVGPGVAANLVQSVVNPVSPTTIGPIPAANFAAGVPVPAVGATTPTDFIVCVLVNNVTFLNPRVLLASVDIVVTGAGVNDPAATAAGAVQTWNINGADFRMTGVKGGPVGHDTVISINNHGVNNATIRRLEVRRLDQLVDPGLGAPPSCVVTNVPAATKTIFRQSGATIRASTDIFNLCSLQAPFIATEAYGARFVLDMAPFDVSIQATRVDPQGNLLSVPVLKNAPVIPGVAGGTQFPNE
jgi:hypothetical protein